MPNLSPLSALKAGASLISIKISVVRCGFHNDTTTETVSINHETEISEGERQQEDGAELDADIQADSVDFRR